MEKYTTDAAGAMAKLEEYGVAIVPSVLGPQECATLKAKGWDFFEQVTAGMARPVDRNDPSTWNTLLDLYPSHGMLFQHWGIGQSEFVWYARQHPAIVEVFAKMWKVRSEELLVSFDGASFQAPPDREDNPTPHRGWGSPAHWLHSDQSLKRPGRECIQGWVTAEEVGPGDATLAVMDKSHKYHAELAKKFPSLVDSKDWVRYDEEAVAFFRARGCEDVRIECPPGSVVLWDSRTAHYGAAPVRGREDPKFRVVAYVCYLPRAKATPKAVKRKREIFEEGRTTSHWPNRPKLFGKLPRTYGRAVPAVRRAAAPQLTPLGRKLAGFN